MEPALLKTNMPGIPLLGRGKVRDIYDLGDQLLIVATDRISAYDCVMLNGIPGKGKILTKMSLFWFNLTRGIVPNHLLTADLSEYPAELRRFASQLEGRSMLVQKAEPIKVECVVRGYLAGSGWRDYQNTGSVCGIPLPSGLVESSRLFQPIFTPATKAETGHDENISFWRMINILGNDAMAAVLKAKSLLLYQAIAEHAESRGIIMADTKFEFGLMDHELFLRLIDEIGTPDSSRFWPKDRYEPGRPQESFDKQFLRDWLDSIGWNHKPPAPELPEDVVQRTAEKYQEALERLTGRN